MQTSMTLGLGAQFRQIIANVLGQVGNAASRGSICENRVLPKRTEHFDEVRFA